ncbi:hypothetical protein DVA67_008330 [Solirubrobacter sp. CPCC 204708]|uniref:Uncharacterized protein n=1 Tax=Solirubrobacter deserti TaxID=2282478 RepID=A0ABT4RDW4_9ACTN|nr:hypothetical protein [Solirubrobacter deserti]MBE2315978.1 hypothetical protein [Solirubrobacter deserti]MDA0136729.1 hypothetical protein [Solirubrobacter deserti]
MKITFHREARGRYHSTFTRPDGAVMKLRGGSYNQLGGGVRVPHDIAHLIVEQTLELRGGLWGTIAVGGLVANLEFIGGKRPPHSEKKAWAITDAAGETLRQSEVMVRAVADAISDGGSVRTGERWAVPVTREQLELMGSQLRNSAARWDQVREGGTLEMTWRI